MLFVEPTVMLFYVITTFHQAKGLERDFVIDLLKQIPLYVFWKNKDSVYLGCNDAFAKSLGFSSPDEILLVWEEL